MKVYIKTILTLNPANDEQTSEKRSGESNFRFAIRVEKTYLAIDHQFIKISGDLNIIPKLESLAIVSLCKRCYS